VVVEDRYASLLKVTHAPAGFLPDLLARVQVRYPEIPIVFTETRPLAEEWTYRWLGAVLAEAMAAGEAWGAMPPDKPAPEAVSLPTAASTSRAGRHRSPRQPSVGSSD
jgi:hypothetical protein